MTVGFGRFGGRCVPEASSPHSEQLDEVRSRRWSTPSSSANRPPPSHLHTGRPSIVTEVRGSPPAGGGRVILKREDLNTGSHKISNVLAQALLTKRMGKRRIIAETGAGQQWRRHGDCGRSGLDCTHMGRVDTRRQASTSRPHARILGAEVIAVEHGSATLKDAINEALRDWVTNVDDTHTASGPSPARTRSRDGPRLPPASSGSKPALRFSPDRPPP